MIANRLISNLRLDGRGNRSHEGYEIAGFKLKPDRPTLSLRCPYLTVLAGKHGTRNTWACRPAETPAKTGAVEFNHIELDKASVIWHLSGLLWRKIPINDEGTVVLEQAAGEQQVAGGNPAFPASTLIAVHPILPAQQR
jgi:hypothetical protein